MPIPARPAGKLRAILDAAAVSLQYIAYCVRDLLACLGVLLIPACLCIFASLVLFLPDQTQDYYRLLVENLADTSINAKDDATTFDEVLAVVRATVDALLPVAFLLGMAACISFSAVALLAERNRPGLWRISWIRRAITFSPVVFGILPLVAAIAGFYASSRAIDLQAETTSMEAIKKFGDDTFVGQVQLLFTWARQSDRYFNLGLWILGTVTVVFLLLSALTVLRNRRPTGEQRERFWHITRRILVASLVFSLAAIVLIAAFPVPIGQTLGSITIFAIFIGALALNATGLSILSRRLDFPIIPAMLVLAGFLALTGLNDNHELRRIDRNGNQAGSSLTSIADPVGNVEDEFKKWYDLRADKDNDEFKKERGYPVYIVAAQGGGIYAAAQAALFLTKLHTTCERFAQHLFAISGVSGGSVGAALYAALTEEFKPTTEQCRSFVEIGIGSPRPGPMEQVQQAAFELVRNDYDFLSPLVASALFPDFAQRFFWPPVAALSRARALEQSIEAAWEATAINRFNGAGGDALKKGVLASWNPGGVKPALFFNTTEVGSGRRRIIAPFGFDRKATSDAQFLPLAADYDVPVSAAAVASARFPWLTPAGWFWGKGKEAIPPAKTERTKFHIVDGGYFENSGVTTAVEIIYRLQRRAQTCCANARFYLIVLTSGEYSNGSSVAFSEAISPVVALFNSRTARTYSTVDLATRDLGVAQLDAKGVLGQLNKVQKVDFGEYVIPLPLGWRLSKVSASEIFFLTGRVGHCVPDKTFTQTPEALKIKGFGSSDCVQRLILHQLRGDDLDVALKQVQAKPPPVPSSN